MKNNAKKLLSVLLALCMALSFVTVASGSDKAYEGKIIVLHTNDVHGAID